MKSKSEIQEALAGLFLYWYGHHPPIRRLLKTEWQGEKVACPEELPVVQIECAWRTRWFAKGELTAKVDEEMGTAFGWLLDDPTLESWTPQDDALWKCLALIVLWDQLPRNIYRGTPQAYAYDQKALDLAVSLAARIEELPFHFQATVCICLCHSETSTIQDLLGTCLKKIDGSGNKRELYVSLQEIARKHAERIELFGQFPERNASLGRPTTGSEAAYLRQLG